MKSGCSLVHLAQELERQLATKQDLVVPSSLLRCHTDEAGGCRMLIEAKDGGGEYGMTELARRQLAEKLKIPFAYFERMRAEQPSLLAMVAIVAIIVALVILVFSGIGYALGKFIF